MSIPAFPEILSPAGNMEMLVAAVRSGADAVYLGATEFSARRNAENFDDAGLQNAVSYCHIRNVKVYLTLNIIIRDSEMRDAVLLAQRAYNIGIDGIIIADLGLAAVLHRLIPDLPLHASTQMSVHSVSALKGLKAMGFCRVVVAREMSYNALKTFCTEAQKMEIEVEVFVHGALCMSVSGQCLLSAFLGSRSGNRGLCAGPCRLPFSVPGGTGHDLSLKDLSLLPHIKALTELGVASFKIEGRMKRPEYAAAATAACRAALDDGFVPGTLDRALKEVFSRSGFTDGYYNGCTGRELFGVRTKEDVTAAAGALPQIHALYRAERRSVPISAHLTARAGEPLSLTLNDGSTEVTVSGEIPQTALHKAVSAEDLRLSIDKFGGTPYLADRITVDCDEGLFVRAAALNELRRNAVEQLDRARSRPSRTQSTATYIPAPKAERGKNPPAVYARFESTAQIPERFDGLAGLIFPLEKDFDITPPETRLIVELPRGISDEGAVERRLTLFSEKGFRTALCGTLAAAEIARRNGFAVIADAGLNTCNSEAAATLSALGAKAIVLSNEILLRDAAALSAPIPKGIVIYGNIPLMLFKSCPLKNGIKCADCDKNGVITDRLGTAFPVRCRMDYSELLNAVPIWLADRRDELCAVDFGILYFTRESKERAAAVINAYQNGLAPDVPYTRGLFYRGTR